MLELDCHLTRDGHVVVSHDENLLRQTGCNVNVSSLDLQVGDTATGRQGWRFTRRQLEPGEYRSHVFSAPVELQ